MENFRVDGKADLDSKQVKVCRFEASKSSDLRLILLRSSSICPSGLWSPSSLHGTPVSLLVFPEQ